MNGFRHNIKLKGGEKSKSNKAGSDNYVSDFTLSDGTLMNRNFFTLLNVTLDGSLNACLLKKMGERESVERQRVKTFF